MAKSKRDEVGRRPESVNLHGKEYPAKVEKKFGKYSLVNVQVPLKDLIKWYCAAQEKALDNANREAGHDASEISDQCVAYLKGADYEAAADFLQALWYQTAYGD